MHRSSPDGQEFVSGPLLAKENLQVKISQLQQEKEQENSKVRYILKYLDNFIIRASFEFHFIFDILFKLNWRALAFRWYNVST